MLMKMECTWWYSIMRRNFEGKEWMINSNTFNRSRYYVKYLISQNFPLDRFLDRIKTNLHIVLCFSPVGEKFRRIFKHFMNMTISLSDPCWNLSICQVSSPQVSWSHLRLHHQLVSGLKIFVLLLNQRWDLSLPALPMTGHEYLSKFLHDQIFGPKILQHDRFHALYNNVSASEPAIWVLSC